MKRRKTFKELMEELLRSKELPEERLIKKLEEIKQSRGSTVNEEQIAKAKIERLKEKMATKTGTGTKPVTSTQITEAVKVWVKAEQSAIWSLIDVVRAGLVSYVGKDRPTRVKQIREWIQAALDKEYGEGAAKDRAAHISKIMKIAGEATTEDMERYKKAGTGFYKAYREFSKDTPSKKKVSPVPAVPAAPAAQREGPTSSGTYAAQEGKTASGDVDNEVPAGGTPGASTKGKEEFDRAEALIGSVVDLIDFDRPKSWNRLITRLTEMKKFILEPGMIETIFNRISQNMRIYRATVQVLLQGEEFRKEVVEYIEQNPQQFDGISVDERKPKKEEPKAKK